MRRLPLLVPPLLLSAAPSTTTMTTRPPFGGLVFMAAIIVVAPRRKATVVREFADGAVSELRVPAPGQRCVLTAQGTGGFCSGKYFL